MLCGVGLTLEDTCEQPDDLQRLAEVVGRRSGDHLEVGVDPGQLFLTLGQRQVRPPELCRCGLGAVVGVEQLALTKLEAVQGAHGRQRFVFDEPSPVDREHGPLDAAERREQGPHRGPVCVDHVQLEVPGVDRTVRRTGASDRRSRATSLAAVHSRVTCEERRSCCLARSRRR